jgi:hypothetical protein
MQALEQFDGERQVRVITALDQGQHIFAGIQADEEVAVLGAFGYPVKIMQPPQLKAEQETFQRRALYRRENRHEIQPLTN